VEALVFGELNELIASGRLRLAGASLAQAGADITAGPGPLDQWREWGLARRTAGDRLAEATIPPDGETVSLPIRRGSEHETAAVSRGGRGARP